MLQFALCCCVCFPSNRQHYKLPPLQIAHVFNCPHVEGLIAISPYMGVIRTFANIRVNTQKRHHGHGMGSFACVVGAICKSPILQITHVTIHPHVEGLIAISPYTGVITTFANIRVNTQKRHHGHGVSTFACVVGAKSASWRSGVCDAIRPYCNSPMSQFTPIANRPCFQLPPCGRANCN